MKSKLKEERFEDDLKKIRKVMNQLIFLKPIVPGTNFEEVSRLFVSDYLQLGNQGIFKLPDNKKLEPGKFLGLDCSPKEKHLDIAKKYTEFFRQHCNSGLGFTPKLILEGSGGVNNYNCLGRAMLLGAYLNFHGVYADLMLSVDHAMCIVEEREHMYLCDPGVGKVFKMHGKRVRHKQYDWYIASPKDKFHFRYLVIQPITVGGLNAAFQSFEFLKSIGWGKIIEKDPFFEDCEKQLLNIMDPRFKYRELINSIDWKNFRTTLFEGIDDYRIRYEREWLLEGERIRLRRNWSSVHGRFDRAAFNACCATRFNGKVSDFHDAMFATVRPMATHIINFLELSLPIRIDIPNQYRTYFQILKNALDQDSELRVYALEVVKAKLLDTGQ